jgi:hypothetical protein
LLIERELPSDRRWYPYSEPAGSERDAIVALSSPCKPLANFQNLGAIAIGASRELRKTAGVHGAFKLSCVACAAMAASAFTPAGICCGGCRRSPDLCRTPSWLDLILRARLGRDADRAGTRVGHRGLALHEFNGTESAHSCRSALYSMSRARFSPF